SLTLLKSMRASSTCRPGILRCFAYCVGELRFSEEAAFKRIHAARAARRSPEIFAAVEDGRLHLSAVVMLAPHLTVDSAADLIAPPGGKTKVEIEQLLAERSPHPDLAICIRPPPAGLAQGTSNTHPPPGRVETPLDGSPPPQPVGSPAPIVTYP